MKDPCMEYAKQAKKHLGIFKRNYWTAGLYYLQAAECYKNSGNMKKAFMYAKEAVKFLEKYWETAGDMVLPDLEKALALAFYTAPKKKKEELRRKAFDIYVYHAKKLEHSRNYLGAAEKYEAAIQYAPSGESAREVLMRAISILERALEKEHVIRNRALVEKIEKKIEK